MTTEEKKCILIVNESSNYSAVNDYIKAMNGFYNGANWFVDYQHKDAVQKLCQNANLRWFDFPLLADSFEKLKRQNKASYYYEKFIKTEIEISKIREILDIPQSVSLEELLQKKYKEKLEQLQEGIKLIELINEHEKLNKKIKQAEEEEKLSKLQFDTNGNFKYLLVPTTEEQICNEIKNTSPGIKTGFKIGDIDLKIPGGAISIYAAPTSHGKTAMLINLALGALSHEGQEDKSVYFFSYEESRAAIFSLFLNTYIGTWLSDNNRESIKSFFRESNTKYLSTKIDKERNSSPKGFFPEIKDRFFKELINPGRLNIFYSEYTTNDLVAAIKFLKKNSSVGLICIDYMQLLTFGAGNFGSRQEELKQVCLLLKDCAVETGLPILLAAQFNRQVTCEGDLSPIYISEAGDIERIASLILGGWNRNFAGFTKEGNKDKGGKKAPQEPAVYLEILKGRETGAGKSTVLDFDGNSGKLTNRKQTPSETTKSMF